jgi:hypothetical protein
MKEDSSQETVVRSKRTDQRQQTIRDKRILQFTVFCFLTTVYCLLMSVIPHSAGAAATDKKSFTYYIYWSGIKGGTAVLDYENTKEGFVVRTHATSLPVINIFYKVDDFAQSILSPDGYPKNYIIKIQEGRHRREKAAWFERKEEGGPTKVIYQNVLDDEKKEFHFDKPVYDMLSAFYAITKMNLEPGQSNYFDIFDSKKLYHTEVQVLRKEKIRVQSREYSTILIKPNLKSEGIFRRTGDVFIWVTDDDRKLPVLMKSKALIGTFTVELAEGDF